MVRLLKLVLPLVGRWQFALLILLAVITGIANFVFMQQSTGVIRLLTSGAYKQINGYLIIRFLGTIFTILATRKILSHSLITLSQRIFWIMRKDILSIVLTADYQSLIKRKDKLQASLMGDVYVLTDATVTIIGYSTAIIMSVSCCVYLASLSVTLFLVTLGFSFAGVSVYWLNSKRYNRLFEKARHEENKFVNALTAILQGFKEIFMEPKKGRYMFEKKIEVVAEDSYRLSTAAQIGYLNNQITGQIFFYLLITSVLLIFSITVKLPAGNLISFIFALFYFLGSVQTMTVMFPGLARAAVSADYLMDLKQDLEQAAYRKPEPEDPVAKEEFRQIVVSGLRFDYGSDEDNFSIGPVDFEINKGEVVFIYGENGSGKTTFIQSILGLLTPVAGAIRFNNITVNEKYYRQYRSLFAVVFSDFFLFDELMGIEKIDRDKWFFYLDLFELTGKVTLENNVLSTTNLSAGQRKRLALICALMEEKHIIVLDEWAADQDPYFRKKFYTEIIAILKEKGFSIIAITHDDKYYQYADRHYRMNFGQLVYHSHPAFAPAN